jgi:hypothetical protein
MSIYGIRGSIVGNPGAPGTGATTSAPARTERRPVAPKATPSATPTASAKTAPATVSVQAPPGTDPDLWSVLSHDERAYFAKLGAMGPLTYGRVLSGQVQPQQAVSRGARLDVKA